MIRVDLCMQRQTADLASPGALTWWKKRAGSGQIVSLGGGPPCETFTAARFQHHHDGDSPRPLRSGALPWGLPGLSRRERDQLWISDRLLFFIVEMLAVMATPWLQRIPGTSTIPNLVCSSCPAKHLGNRCHQVDAPAQLRPIH